MTTQTSNVIAGKWSDEYIASLPDSSFAWIDATGTRHLPYKADDGRVNLPQVRNALAKLDQVDASQRESIKDKLQGSLKADNATDVVLSSTHAIQADDSGKLPNKVMLLRAGTFNTTKYGEVPLKASDLAEMKSNFEKGVGMADEGQTGIPIDYGHKSGENAAGWIKNLSIESDTLFGENIEWSGSGRKALIDKEYKCLSSDFYPAAFGEWVDAESGVRAKNVIVGAALTNRPMFTGNQPVIASDAADAADDGSKRIEKIVYVIASQKETSMNIDEVRVKAADDVSGAEQRFLQANAAELSADERTKFEIAEPAKAGNKDQKPEVKADAVKGDEGVVSVQASELKAINDKVAALEATNAEQDKATIREEVKKHVARGAIKADRIDSYVNRIAASNADERKELYTDLDAIASNPLLAKEQGSNDADESIGTDPRTELMNKAVKMSEESKGTDNEMTIQQAVAKVMATEKDLADAAAKQRKEQLSSVEATADQYTAAGVNRG